MPKAIPVMSMKGGVGKTTITVGIARALHREGYAVGLLDVDVSGSALPRALGLIRDPGYEVLDEGRLQPARVDGMQVFSIGLLFPEDAPNMWRGDMRADGIRQILSTDIAWDPLDFLVIDTPPTSGDEARSLLENLVEVHGAVIVTQPNELSLLGLRKTVRMLKETGTPIAGMVANMAGYRCPHCQTVSNPFDRAVVHAEQVAQEVEIPYLGDVPLTDEAEREQVIAQITQRVISGTPMKFKVKEGDGWRRRLIGGVVRMAGIATR